MIELRSIAGADPYFLWYWIHGVSNPEWAPWDAPHFKRSGRKSIQDFMAGDAKWFHDTDQRMTFVDGRSTGIVMKYEELPVGSHWWEIGIIPYDPDRWGRGIGRQALELRVSMIFEKTDVHLVTLTTWSGNEWMVRAASRVGFFECARIPEAREWNGKRWDSVRMVLPRKAWEKQFRPVLAKLLRGRVTSRKVIGC